jgi:hypothetical protein
MFVPVIWQLTCRWMWCNHRLNMMRARSDQKLNGDLQCSEPIVLLDGSMRNCREAVCGVSRLVC